MIFEICAVIATLVFAVTAYFIIQCLRELQQSLKSLQDKVEPLLQKSSAITDSVHEKLHAFDPLFNSIHQAAQVVEDKTSTLAHSLQTTGKTHKHHQRDTVSHVIQWVAVSILLWQQMNREEDV